MQRQAEQRACLHAAAAEASQGPDGREVVGGPAEALGYYMGLVRLATRDVKTLFGTDTARSRRKEAMVHALASRWWSCFRKLLAAPCSS